jgi:dihydroorotate dehydrogenase (NAD+) catalytic subunit
MMAGAEAVEVGTAVLQGVDIFSAIAHALYAPGGIDADEIVGCAHA